MERKEGNLHSVWVEVVVVVVFIMFSFMLLLCPPDMGFADHRADSGNLLWLACGRDRLAEQRKRVCRLAGR